jgi:hypothetical protein
VRLSHSAFVLVVAGSASFAADAFGQCHPVPPVRMQLDLRLTSRRRDIAFLPDALKNRLFEMVARPHTFLPIQVFGEADTPSQLFQYYLIDTHGFQPNVFTTPIPGVNDLTLPTATGANCDIPTIGAVRLVVEPKPGLPTDPSDPGAFIDVFTDISGLFVINNESGWYEGWMIHDLRVVPVDDAREDGHAKFGKITAADEVALASMGSRENVPGNLFTTDGQAPRFPSESDRFPTVQSNLVPIHLSMGAYNAMQQADAHSYWEFNYQTNWIHPLYELAFTGGIPGTFEQGLLGAFPSIVPGSGPRGIHNDPRVTGDDPNNPRDPDRAEGDGSQIESRNRFVPSGLAREILLDVFERPLSFEPGVVAFRQRLFDAYAAEVARIDENGDGAIAFEEADIEDESDGQSNERLFLPATSFDRFAVTREINDGILAPRFAPSQRAWVLTGRQTLVDPAVPASAGHDGDDR